MGVWTDKEKKDPEHGMLTNKDLGIRLEYSRDFLMTFEHDGENITNMMIFPGQERSGEKGIKLDDYI